MITNNSLANVLRFLSIDMIDRANSGHPGFPLGMADVMMILFKDILVYNPSDPLWEGRDRLILSGGHGSTLLYSSLFLAGYDYSITDLKNFRQLKSKAPGHPEINPALGIETTTGPLGQGIANGVGLSIASLRSKALFGDLYDSTIYVFCGDGDLMEGLSYEATALAGNLQLSNLILLFDNNAITIDGSTSISSSENVKARFIAQNWQVLSCDAYDHKKITESLKKAKKADLPTVIFFNSKIGYGSPLEGKKEAHGSPLGAHNNRLTREKLNWQYPAFVIPEEISSTWKNFSNRNQSYYQYWQKNLTPKVKDSTAFAKKLITQIDYIGKLQEPFIGLINKFINEGKDIATRSSNQKCLDVIFKTYKDLLIGGSADLTSSNLTFSKYCKTLNKQDYSGSYLNYGIREHAMAAVMNGISLEEKFIPYGGTFLVFSDYARGAIRLSALMKRFVVYVFSHDSIAVGEDGPTHQPIEQLASLRAIPNLSVIRPADAIENALAWLSIFKNKKPTALILTRQNLPILTSMSSDITIDNYNNFHRGGYNFFGPLDAKIVLIASGSEVKLAMDIARDIKIPARVVSMPNLNLFKSQSKEYQNKVLGNNSIPSNTRVIIEAGIKMGWGELIREKDLFFGVDSFGYSAKMKDIFKYVGLDKELIIKKIVSNLK